MTIGELAGLIAALAFTVLVGFVCFNLAKLPQILKDLNDTVTKVNTTIDVLTKDVDNLSIEVEGLLNKANTLVDDVNGKLSKTDPLFVAIGDLGITVSDLNESTKQMTTNLLSGVGKKKRSSPIEKFVNTTRTMSKRRPRSTSSHASEAHSQTDKGNLNTESEIFSIKNQTPSTTAGEISIK